MVNRVESLAMVEKKDHGHRAREWKCVDLGLELFGGKMSAPVAGGTRKHIESGAAPAFMGRLDD